MSDDLICTNCGEYVGSPIADRIEELEAKNTNLFDLACQEHERAETAEYKLAKAVETLDKTASALNRVAWGGDFTCFVDAEWVAVNNALDEARATLSELKAEKDKTDE